MNKIILTCSTILIVGGCQQSPTGVDTCLEKYQRLIHEAEQQASKPMDPNQPQNNPLERMMSPTTNWKIERAAFRTNPFLPIESNAASIEKTTTANEGKQPSERPLPFELTGVIRIGETKKALINGKLYQVGEEIDQHTILMIEGKSVTLQNGKKTITLQLKEN
jgi:hypothetical protein